MYSTHGLPLPGHPKSPQKKGWEKLLWGLRSLETKAYLFAVEAPAQRTLREHILDQQAQPR